MPTPSLSFALDIAGANAYDKNVLTRRSSGRSRMASTLLAALVGLVGACASNDEGDGDGSAGSGSGGMGVDFGNSDAGMPTTPEDGGTSSGGSGGSGATGGGSGLAPCQTVDVRNVDLLFMVDNSLSMSEEQASLREQFPRLIETLTTGDRDGDGNEDFPPVENLHLGVVSSDIGLGGVEGIPSCDALGDDGILRSTPDATATGCGTDYPLFLDYVAGDDDPATIAADFGCIATLGTEGCGFEQQLEAPLKALWPERDIDPTTGMPRDPNRITFLGNGTGSGTTGHADGLNAGFLRPKSGEDVSVVAIVIVSDEEDCSSHDTSHFTPDSLLPTDDPLRDQDLNLRCFYNKDNLYPISRYVDGFKLLREGNEQLVVFAAIVGVPPDLVDAAKLADVDFADETSRNDFYDFILDDVRMVETVDPARPAEQGNLMPSCDVPGVGVAYPPRRIVEVARDFGERGIVQSICQDDFGPAMDVLVSAIGQTIGESCIVE